jgi:uncharacterized protein YdeI (YjbR/CyaY-like superfamily)
MSGLDPVFFTTPAELRRWLRRNHASARELWVGLRRKGSEIPSITWPELVDQLLCFGWIDGIRRSLDETSYAIRVTPRRDGSMWSRVNIRRARELGAQGLMEPPGRLAFEGRREEVPERHDPRGYPAEWVSFGEPELRANLVAWGFFQGQPPGYRRTAAAWVMSAKREETRRRRLATLIEDSEQGRRIAPLRRA